VNAEVSPEQAGSAIVPIMQNGLDIAVAARPPLPPRLQAIGDNVANMNAAGRWATGASFEAEAAQAGEAARARSDPRQTRRLEL
jgi:flagellar basal body rod protein FlgG